MSDLVRNPEDRFSCDTAHMVPNIIQVTESVVGRLVGVPESELAKCA